VRENYNGNMEENAPTKDLKGIQTQPVWGDILDELRIKESLVNDTSLARSLGVTRGYISLIRMGKKDLSLRLAEEVFRRLGRGRDVDVIKELIVEARIKSRYQNLAWLRRYIIDRANGICQLCSNQAPFAEPDGRPYLEIHQLQPASQGGVYRPENLVALCPNCNRKMGINPTQKDAERLKTILEGYENK
jgi:plasmid maintenance system antidote protein VapI